jgi:hypothetical protein
MTFAILILLFTTLLINPWATHMGGRWTPALTWHGVGKLQSTSGANYGLFLEVTVDLPSGRHSSGMGSRDNLQGTAKLCTPQGDVYPLRVTGDLKHAWLDAAGKPVSFSLRSLKDAQPRLNFDLYGSWQGQDLVLADKGSMAMSFAPDGRVKGYLRGTNSPSENSAGALHYATESEFATVCNAKTGNSF